MLTAIHPKLPMRNKSVTRDFYVNKLGFQDVGIADFEGYLLLEKDNIELHFFEFKDLIPEENYGQVYIRTNDIETLYKTFIEKNVSMPKLGHLEHKPWGQTEFSVIDPDHNLLTFGQSIF